MNPKIIKPAILAACLISMAAGLFGMLFCFVFLWSARMEDLVGAGFPFVAGSILFGCGLIGLAITAKENPAAQ
ncbi:MAG: hypothetical protein H6581_10775 [Bacteroidia bacterium]|nr:hypothetical protein [Bacteroidia bacterium]